MQWIPYADGGLLALPIGIVAGSVIWLVGNFKAFFVVGREVLTKCLSSVPLFSETAKVIFKRLEEGIESLVEKDERQETLQLGTTLLGRILAGAFVFSIFWLVIFPMVTVVSTITDIFGEIYEGAKLVWKGAWWIIGISYGGSIVYCCCIERGMGRPQIW